LQTEKKNPTFRKNTVSLYSTMEVDWAGSSETPVHICQNALHGIP